MGDILQHFGQRLCDREATKPLVNTATTAPARKSAICIASHSRIARARFSPKSVAASP